MNLGECCSSTHKNDEKCSDHFALRSVCILSLARAQHITGDEKLLGTKLATEFSELPRLFGPGSFVLILSGGGGLLVLVAKRNLIPGSHSSFAPSSAIGTVHNGDKRRVTLDFDTGFLYSGFILLSEGAFRRHP